MSDNSQKFIARNRAPRVQIEYDVELYGSEKKVQLPFVMGVMSDLSGKSKVEQPSVSERKFLEIDADNFDERMKAMQPRAAFSVPNTLTGDGNLSVDLTFEKMDDFSPAAIAAKIEPLQSLLQARTELRNLMAYMDGKTGAETLIEKILADPSLLAAVSGGGATAPDQQAALDSLRDAMPVETAEDDGSASVLDGLRAATPHNAAPDSSTEDALASLAGQSVEEVAEDDGAAALEALRASSTEAKAEDDGSSALDALRAVAPEDAVEEDASASVLDAMRSDTPAEAAPDTSAEDALASLAGQSVEEVAEDDGAAALDALRAVETTAEIHDDSSTALEALRAVETSDDRTDESASSVLDAMRRSDPAEEIPDRSVDDALTSLAGQPMEEAAEEDPLSALDDLRDIASQEETEADDAASALDALREAAPAETAPDGAVDDALAGLADLGSEDAPEEDDSIAALESLAQAEVSAPETDATDDALAGLVGLDVEEAPQEDGSAAALESLARVEVSEPEADDGLDDLLGGLVADPDVADEGDALDDLLGGTGPVAADATGVADDSQDDLADAALNSEVGESLNDLIGEISGSAEDGAPDEDGLDDLLGEAEEADAAEAELDGLDDLLEGLDGSAESVEADLPAQEPEPSGGALDLESAGDDLDDLLGGFEEDFATGDAEETVASSASEAEADAASEDAPQTDGLHDFVGGEDGLASEPASEDSFGDLLGLDDFPEPEATDDVSELSGSESEVRGAETDELDDLLGGLEDASDPAAEDGLDDLLNAASDVPEAETTGQDLDAPEGLDDLLGGLDDTTDTVEVDALPSDARDDAVAEPDGFDDLLVSAENSADDGLDDLLGGLNEEPAASGEETFEADGLDDLLGDAENSVDDGLDDLLGGLDDDSAEAGEETSEAEDLDDLLGLSEEDGGDDLDDLLGGLGENDTGADIRDDVAAGAESSGGATLAEPEFAYGMMSSARPDAEVLKRKRFRIALFGDFSGRAARGVIETGDRLASRAPIILDPDTVEDVIQRFGTTLVLPIGKDGAGVEVKLSELDDLHPDELYENVELFSELVGLRAQLGMGATAESAAKRLREWAETHGTYAAPPKTRAGGSTVRADLKMSEFQKLIGDTSGSLTQASPIEDLMARVVGPHIRAIPDADAVAMQKAVDDSLSAAMRLVLHHPDFQSLEAQWRSLDLIARSIEVDDTLDVVLYDVSAEEIAVDLASADDLSESGLVRLLTGEPLDEENGRGGYSAMFGLYSFEETPPHAELLGRIARVAAHVDAPFFAAMTPGFMDVDKKERHPLVAEAWDTLRGMSEAKYLGLVSPRFMLRRPYGAKSEPIYEFEFEEFTMQSGLGGMLWANPVVLVAILMAKSFKENGKSMGLGSIMSLGDIPYHFVNDRYGDQVQLPCTERNLTQDKVEKVMARGFMPVVSIKGRDEIRLASFQSVGGGEILGPWSGEVPPEPSPPKVVRAERPAPAVTEEPAGEAGDDDLDSLLAGFEDLGGDDTGDVDADLAALLDDL
ncbi:type VI secretion system contractile sheath small subunit [Sulfitobacter sp. BDSS02]|nr:type VI secretion system contractile sheath small subunit [Sulfitobacter sp. BDSS02]MBR9850160.1 type VI secretion system contractile sheath small subunit [Paracoccaceae bacterium]